MKHSPHRPSTAQLAVPSCLTAYQWLQACQDDPLPTKTVHAHMDTARAAEMDYEEFFSSPQRANQATVLQTTERWRSREAALTRIIFPPSAGNISVTLFALWSKLPFAIGAVLVAQSCEALISRQRLVFLSVRLIRKAKPISASEGSSPNGVRPHCMCASG